MYRERDVYIYIYMHIPICKQFVCVHLYLLNPHNGDSRVKKSGDLFIICFLRNTQPQNTIGQSAQGTSLPIMRLGILSGFASVSVSVFVLFSMSLIRVYECTLIKKGTNMFDSHTRPRVCFCTVSGTSRVMHVLSCVIRETDEISCT